VLHAGGLCVRKEQMSICRNKNQHEQTRKKKGSPSDGERTKDQKKGKTAAVKQGEKKGKKKEKRDQEAKEKAGKRGRGGSKPKKGSRRGKG